MENSKALNLSDNNILAQKTTKNLLLDSSEFIMNALNEENNRDCFNIKFNYKNLEKSLEYSFENYFNDYYSF